MTKKEKINAYKKLLRENRKAEGLCYSCGKQAGEYSRCAECRSQERACASVRRARRTSEGACVSCGNNAMAGSSSKCTKCWWRSITTAVKHAPKWSLIVKPELIVPLMDIMFDQNFRCALSGRRLVPGHNASIDHIKPVSKYPELSSDLNNLQWVTIGANRAKNNHDESDFIQLCNDITNHNKIGD